MPARFTSARFVGREGAFARLGSALDAAGDGRATTSPERRHARVFEAVLGTLGRLAEQRPVALVLEDLHHADAATRDLVTFLARIARNQRLCLVATWQPDELTRAHPLVTDLARI